MIKAKRGNQLIIGLSHENLERLKNDQPIKFDGGQVGFPGVQVFIFSGKDEMEMQKMLSAAIDPLKTIIKSDRAKDN